MELCPHLCARRGRPTEDEREVWLQSISGNNKAGVAVQQEAPEGHNTTCWVASPAYQNQVVPHKVGPPPCKFVLSLTCLVAFARESA